MELIFIMFAAWLAGLSRGNQKNGLVPIREIGYETLGRPVMTGSGTRTERGAGLGLIGKAQQFLQEALLANGVQHVEVVESFPRPVFRVGIFGSFFQMLYRFVRCGGEQFVVTPKLRRQPAGGTFGQNTLQERNFSPVIELGSFPDLRFENQIKRSIER